jgi:beta-lactamase regulating signal transducer with metallopeptidase domain
MAWWILQHLVTATLLAALVQLICRVVAAGPVLRHALWAVVLIKLVTPPMVLWPWSVVSVWNGPTPTMPAPVVTLPIAGLAASDQAPAILLSREAPQLPRVTASEAADTARGVFRAPAAPDRSTPEAPPARAVGALSWSRALLWLWVGGGLAFVMLHAARARRLRRFVRHSAAPSPALDQQVADVARQLGMRAVSVRIAAVPSPLVFAIGRPILLWPAALPALPSRALRSLIAHELAHVKRRDHWVGWIELLGACLWWWNPLFWHVRSQIRTNAELACDAWATHVTPDARRSYAEALLIVCATPTSLSTPMPAVGISTGDRRLLERRLAMIMRASVPVRLSRVTSVVVALIAAVSLPAWAQRAGTAPAPVTPTPPTATPSQTPRPSVPAAQRPPRPAVAAPVFDVSLPPMTVPIFDQEALPAEARALVDRYNEALAAAQREVQERLSRQREDLIQRLLEIQDAETKAGHLDEAVAVRARVRQLQAAPGVQMTFTPAYSGGVQRWDGATGGWVSSPDAVTVTPVISNYEYRVIGAPAPPPPLAPAAPRSPSVPPAPPAPSAPSGR